MSRRPPRATVVIWGAAAHLAPALPVCYVVIRGSQIMMKEPGSTESAPSSGCPIALPHVEHSNLREVSGDSIGDKRWSISRFQTPVSLTGFEAQHPGRSEIDFVETRR